VFRIFHEIRTAEEWHGRNVGDIAYMIDQSHNLKPKIEAMIQTVTTAQELYAKACLVDREKLSKAQATRNIVDAEETLRKAFYTDVRPLLETWRVERHLAPNPLKAYRASGYFEEITKVRGPKKDLTGSSYA
jgi:L-rhamnose isomerase/sugar isomerase